MLGLDYPRERYFRFYCRNTAQWALLPWQARALYGLLGREADRAGLVHCSRSRGVEASLAAICDLPLEVVSVGLPALADEGFVVVERAHVRIASFVESQESAASGALRTEAYRERKRANILVTGGDAVKRAVTDGDASDPVPYRAVPCRADPISGSSEAGSRSSTNQKRADLVAGDPVAGEARQVVARIRHHRARLGLPALPKAKAGIATIAARLREGVPLPELIAAVDLRAGRVERGQDGEGYFDAVSPFTAPSGGRPGGWSYSRDLLTQARRRQPRAAEQQPRIEGPDGPDGAPVDGSLFAAAARRLRSRADDGVTGGDAS